MPSFTPKTKTKTEPIKTFSMNETSKVIFVLSFVVFIIGNVISTSIECYVDIK